MGDKLFSLVIRLIRFLRHKYVSSRVYNKEVTIICNNCTGADILHMGGCKFCTPTVNLFIPAEDFIKFIENLDYYLHCELKECKVFTDRQRSMIKLHLNGKEPEEARFPFGTVGDVLICFMHYDSFDEAYKAWERRKIRIVYDHFGLLLVVRDEEKKYAYEFDKVNVPYCSKKVVLTMNDEIKGLNNSENIVVPNIPNGVHWMAYRSLLKKYYEQNFNIIDYLNSL